MRDFFICRAKPHASRQRHGACGRRLSLPHHSRVFWTPAPSPTGCRSRPPSAAPLVRRGAVVDLLRREPHDIALPDPDPSAIELVDLDLAADCTFVGNEGFDWRSEFFEGKNCFEPCCHTDEMSALAQPAIIDESPIQDAGAFGGDPRMMAIG